MIDIRILRTIGKDARENINLSSDRKKIKSKWHRFWFVFMFYILPYFTSATIILFPFLDLINADCWLSKVAIFIIDTFPSLNMPESEGVVGTIISIFTGLFFSLLLGVNDKIKGERKNPDKDNTSFQKYKENMIQISSMILYIILVGIEIFVLLILNLFFKQFLPFLIENIFTALILFLLIRYIAILLSIIQRFYYTTRDEINGVL